MLKSMISDKNTLKNSHLQQLYNNLNDTKNFSLLGDRDADGKNDEQTSAIAGDGNMENQR